MHRHYLLGDANAVLVIHLTAKRHFTSYTLSTRQNVLVIKEAFHAGSKVF